MVGRIIQLVFGLALVGWSIQGILPMLGEQQTNVTMAGVLYLGAFLVGLDIVGRGMRSKG